MKNDRYSVGPDTVPWLTVDTTVSADSRTAVVSAEGEVDRDSAPALEKAVETVLTGPLPRTVDVDLSAVTFLDSAGLRCLVICRERAAAAGSRMRLVYPSPQVTHVLTISGLAEVFELPGR